ncbi:hypothetical protein LEP1GSC058_3025 [Leptospira fainei serovar Hurstbridge str. BUT 6]|uniref:Uncharacterized protein n=1 Tax=Leptospira fainei serovar Hurstbridge str. BUT 6 TaxID=1193011 RepID=S3URB5_9LEPT|nr:hypothetical protein LEP1GSC058_3025 [Leptospira fainei serovar Hurstbridge str. BUT 6]
MGAPTYGVQKNALQKKELYDINRSLTRFGTSADPAPAQKGWGPQKNYRRAKIRSTVLSERIAEQTFELEAVGQEAVPVTLQPLFSHFLRVSKDSAPENLQ